MIPYSEDEWRMRLFSYGTVFTLTRRNKENNKVEHFILDNEEVMIKELQDDKQKL